MMFGFKQCNEKYVLTILGKDIIIKKYKTKLYRQVRQIIQSHQPLKITIGASSISEVDFIPTEQADLDVLDSFSWKQIPYNSVDIFLAEHVWEHLTLQDGEKALKNCLMHLKAGGHIRIAVPDGYHPNQDYIDYVKPDGYGVGSDDHKVLYNYQMIKKICETNNWKLYLLEYWDENGEFHFVDWHISDGMVHRSKRFDRRNVQGELNYTSLIFDIVR